jgi:hypothetical protein
VAAKVLAKSGARSLFQLASPPSCFSYLLIMVQSCLIPSRKTVILAHAGGAFQQISPLAMDFRLRGNDESLVFGRSINRALKACLNRASIK